MENPDAILRKAGLMSAHVALFNRMNALRQMLFLAEVLDERQASAALVRAGNITTIGPSTQEEPSVTSHRGRTADAATCYSTLAELKGHVAEMYAVTTPELKALNAQAIEALKASDDLAAFAATLTKLDGDGADTARRSRTAPTPPATPAETPATAS
ncbi:multidrug DMT transporter [Deinococcus roseus]|nr:multidrug DMT transporter [Deinococcus roseus]